MKNGRVVMTGGFWLLLGLLLLANAGALLFWALVACTVHELGHLAAVRALGGQVGQFRLTGTGPVLIPFRRRLFSYGEENLIALAGPGASLLLALAAGAWARHTASPGICLLTGLSLALGIFNLLPACPLDGGRVLRSVVSRLAGPDRGERTCLWMTRVLALLLTGAGLLIWRVNGNFTLLLCGVWLVSGVLPAQKR